MIGSTTAAGPVPQVRRFSFRKDLSRHFHFQSREDHWRFLGHRGVPREIACRRRRTRRRCRRKGDIFRNGMQISWQSHLQFGRIRPRRCVTPWLNNDSLRQASAARSSQSVTLTRVAPPRMHHRRKEDCSSCEEELCDMSMVMIHQFESVAGGLTSSGSTPNGSVARKSCSKPMSCIDVSCEHTPINFPSRKNSINIEHDFAASVFIGKGQPAKKVVPKSTVFPGGGEGSDLKVAKTDDRDDKAGLPSGRNHKAAQG